MKFTFFRITFDHLVLCFEAGPGKESYNNKRGRWNCPRPTSQDDDNGDDEEKKNGAEAPGDGVHSQGLMVGLLGRHKRSVGSQWIMNPRIGNLKTKYGS